MPSNLPFPHGANDGQIGAGSLKSTTMIPGSGPPGGPGGMFIGPNEDLTSAGVNRGPWALSHNIQHIWNRMHTSEHPLAVPAMETFTAGGGGDANITLTADDFFIGMSGDTDPGYLFQILDEDYNPLHVGGTLVTADDVCDHSMVSYYALAEDTFAEEAVVVFSASIPAGTVYNVMYATRTGLENMDANALVDVFLRTYQRSGLATASRVFDRSTPNACLGEAPTLTFAGGGVVEYTEFWCHINGRVYHVPAGHVTTTAAFITIHVDVNGEVQGTSDAVYYPAVSPETNIILGYGQWGGSWADEYSCGRQLNSKPVYITVGESETHETNFETLNEAINFTNYLHERVRDSLDLAEEGMESPKIYIMAPTTITETINLAGPVHIVGGVGSLDIPSSMERHPQVLIDFTNGPVFACNFNGVVVENLAFAALGAPRNGYLFDFVGPLSKFSRIYTMAYVGDENFGGFVYGSQQLIIEHSFLGHLNDTAGPAIFLDGAFGCKIDHCEISLVLGDAVHLADAENSELSNTRIYISEYGGAGTGTALALSGNSGRDVVLKQCRLANGESGGDTPLVINGTNYRVTLIDSIVKLDDNLALQVGDTTPIARLICQNCNIGTSEIDALEVRITGGVLNNMQYTCDNHRGDFSIKDTRFEDVTSEHILVLTPIGGHLHKYLIKNATFEFSGAVGPANAIRLDDAGAYVPDFVVDSCIFVHAENIPRINFVNVADGSGAENIVICNNTIDLTANTFFGEVLRPISIGLSAEARTIRVQDNNITLRGDVFKSMGDPVEVELNSMTVAAGLTSVYIKGDANNKKVWVQGNHLRFIPDTADIPQCVAGIMILSCNDVSVIDNNVLNFKWGIVNVVYDFEGAPPGSSTERAFFRGNTTLFGNYTTTTAEIGDWGFDNRWNSAAGIICGVGLLGLDPLCTVRNVVLSDNQIYSMGIADDSSHPVHRDMLHVNAETVCCHNSTFTEEVDYKSGPVQGHTLYYYYIEFSEQIRPYDGGSSILRRHNGCTSVSQVTSEPST